MFDKEKEKPLGIIRKIGAGFVLEQSCFNHQVFGLSRMINYDSRTTIRVWKDFKVLAELYFDNNFNEISRKGPQLELLEGVSPADFMHKDYTPIDDETEEQELEEEEGEEELEEENNE